MTKPISHYVLTNVLYHYGIHLYTLPSVIFIMFFSYMFCDRIIDSIKELYIYENKVILIVPAVIGLTIILDFQLIRFINSILMSLLLNSQ